MLLAVRKILFIYDLYTYSSSGKMKIHMNYAFSYGKNDLEKWLNAFRYVKNIFYVLLTCILF
jgi:hypothetical protein